MRNSGSFYEEVMFMTTCSLFQALMQSGLVISAVVGACTAVRGLNVWRKQLRGTNEYERARKLMRAVYVLRDNINNCRKPFTNRDELRGYADKDGITINHDDPNFFRKVEQLVYTHRWIALQSALAGLHIEKSESEVIWGDKISELIYPIFHLVAELEEAKIVTYSEDLQKRFGDEKANSFAKKLHTDGPEDEFDKRVYESVKSIRSFLEPKLHH